MRAQSIWNRVPHALTGLRILLVVPIIYGILQGDYLKVAILFLIAMGTDFLDGFCARRFGVESSFGALFDIVADKCLVLGTVCALFYFSDYKYMRWFLYIILFRESILIIGSSFLYVFFKSYTIQTQPKGKYSMALQFGTVLLIIGDLAGYDVRTWLFIVAIAAFLGSIISLAEYAKKVHATLIRR